MNYQGYEFGRQIVANGLEESPSRLRQCDCIQESILESRTIIMRPSYQRRTKLRQPLLELIIHCQYLMISLLSEFLSQSYMYICACMYAYTLITMVRDYDMMYKCNAQIFINICIVGLYL